MNIYQLEVRPPAPSARTRRCYRGPELLRLRSREINRDLACVDREIERLRGLGVDSPHYATRDEEIRRHVGMLERLRAEQKRLQATPAVRSVMGKVGAAAAGG